jgi:hypothetical protein
MNVTIQGRRVTLDKSTMLARGGEGEIHIDPDFPRAKALKIYHQPSANRAEKLGAMLKLGAEFPREVAAPLALVHGSSSEVVGFQMQQLNRRFVRAAELFKAEFCKAAGFSAKQISDVYLKVAANLLAVHPKRIVVSDLNDGAFLIHQENGSICWVDVDSWQVPGYPCIVGTELYLCPALYGVDLSRGTHFEPWHDWFSYAVLLFRSLLRKHPFKAGTHPAYRSVIERARNGLTVLDAGVSYPAAGLKPEVLSDSLTEALLGHLKGQVRGPFPLAVLQQYRDELVACGSCGLWYPQSRKSCPGCSVRTTVDASRRIELELEELLAVKGQVLLVQTRKKELRCLCEEYGQLVLHSGEPGRIARHDLKVAYKPTMRVGLTRDLLTVSSDDDPDADTTPLYLLRITPQGLAPLKQLSTTVYRGQGPVSASSQRFIYRLAQTVLLACEPFAEHDVLERPVTQVFENQCWFTCDPDPEDGTEVLCGFNRDRSLMRWFISTCPPGQTSFSTKEAPIPELNRGESLLDLSVTIRGGECLVVRRTKLRGKERVKLDLIDAETAALRLSTEVDPAVQTHWESIRGIGFAGGVVMHPTDQGIVREDLGTGQSSVMKDSQRLVSSDDTLLPYQGGILRVASNRLVLISKRP